MPLRFVKDIPQYIFSADFVVKSVHNGVHMKVENINNNQTFRARIVINKSGFKNIAKNITDSKQIGLSTVDGVVFDKQAYNNLGHDSADFSMTTFPSVKLSAGTLLETSALPSEIQYRKGFLGFISNSYNEIKQKFGQILKRDIKTVKIDIPQDLRIQSTNYANISGNGGAGISSISTGIASYSGSAASGTENILYHGFLPESAAESVKNIGFVKSMHEELIKLTPDASANLAASTLSSGSGLGAQVVGLGSIDKANKIIKNNRNFLS